MFPLYELNWVTLEVKCWTTQIKDWGKQKQKDWREWEYGFLYL